jgi:hypothetical protein
MENELKYDIMDLIVGKPKYLVVMPTRAKLFLKDYILPEEEELFINEVNNVCDYVLTLPFRGDQRSDIDFNIEVNNLDIEYLTELSNKNILQCHIDTSGNNQYFELYAERLFLRNVMRRNKDAWQFCFDRGWVDVDHPHLGVGDYCGYFKRKFGGSERAEKEYRQSLIDHERIGKYICGLLNREICECEKSSE